MVVSLARISVNWTSVMRPSYKPHFASCPSVRPSVFPVSCLPCTCAWAKGRKPQITEIHWPEFPLLAITRIAAYYVWLAPIFFLVI